MGTNTLFTEDDLQSILKGLISVLAFFQENNITHGDCHPSSIYFDERNGTFKVYDNDLLVGRTYAFKQALGDLSQSFYLSPELIVAMREEDYQLTKNTIWKTDVFALGMTLLEVACLCPSSKCYDSSYSLLNPLLQERLQFVKNHYSQILYFTLHKMLELDERRRPDFQQIWKALNGNEWTQLNDEQDIPQQYQQIVLQQPNQTIIPQSQSIPPANTYSDVKVIGNYPVIEISSPQIGVLPSYSIEKNLQPNIVQLVPVNGNESIQDYQELTFNKVEDEQGKKKMVQSTNFNLTSEHLQKLVTENKQKLDSLLTAYPNSIQTQQQRCISNQKSGDKIIKSYTYSSLIKEKEIQKGKSTQNDINCTIAKIQEEIQNSKQKIENYQKLYKNLDNGSNSNINAGQQASNLITSPNHQDSNTLQKYTSELKEDQNSEIDSKIKQTLQRSQDFRKKLI